MKSFSIYEIREALRYGNQNKYVLFPEIRDKANIKAVQENHKTSYMVKDLIDYAKAIVEEKPSTLPFSAFIEFTKSGNRYYYERMYFKSKKEIHALVMAEIFEDNNTYIQAIEDRLWQWCDLYTWELPAHVPLTPEAIEQQNIEADEVVALFSAETGFYFAEILSLIGDKLNPLLRYRLEKEIFRRIINSYKKRSYNWEEVTMNWSSVCAGAVGCAALYMVEDINELSIIISRVIASMESFLLGFDKDGVITEGLSYWNYGFSFFVYFSELLRERTCGKIDLLKEDEKIQKIAELPLYLQFPDGAIVTFSDSSDSRWEGSYGFLCRLSSIFNIKDYRFPEKTDIFSDHTSKWAVTSRNIFWVDLNAEHKNQSTRTGMFYFSECQWLIDRRLKDTDLFYAFAAKGGHNDEPHNHNDLGHFILYYNSDPLFVDLGAPEYTKQFFSSERYSFLHASSKGHSVPIINGEYQADGPEYQARVLEASDNSGKVNFELDLKEAYAIQELQEFRRTFVWDYEGLTLTINDRFKFNKDNNQIEEAFITRYKPSIVEDGLILVQGKNSKAFLNFEKGRECRIVKEEFIDHHGQKDEAYRILIKYDGLGADFNSKIEITID